jgi:ABC-type glycerol-3-phosphate transport system substrate-binding protein
MNARESRRSFLRKATVLAGATVTALHPWRASAQTSSRAVAIRFLGHVTPDGATTRDQAMKVIAERFGQKHPSIKLQFERIPWQEIQQKYMTAWEAGNAPDLTLVDKPYVSTNVRQGSIADLTPYLNRWPKGEPEDFYSKLVWQHGILNGKKYAMQTFMHTYVLAYRKSLFSKAGYDVTKIRTWDDFVKAAQAVTVDRNGKKPTDAGFDPRNVQTWGFGAEGARNGNWAPALGWMFTELGQPVVSEKDWKADWTGESAVKAFTLVTDFITKHKIQSPGDLSADLDTAENNFAAGLYASTIAYTNRLESVRAKMQYDWKDVAYLRPPTFDGKRPGPLATRFWTMAMNSKSKAKDEAWLFMSEYFGRQGDMDMVIPGGQLPMRSSNLQRPEFATPEKAYVQTVKQGFAEWGFMEPDPPTSFRLIWTLAYHEIVSQGVPVKQALQKAQDSYHKLLSEATEK